MRPTTIERILARIRVTETGCWFWEGTTNQYGYGQIKVDGRLVVVHRYVWGHYVGVVPVGLEMDHRCRIPQCCNPDHLEPVTRNENQRRGQNGTRPLVCKRGHWLLGDNVRFRMSAHQRSESIERNCLTCARDYDRAYKAARRP